MDRVVDFIVFWGQKLVYDQKGCSFNGPYKLKWFMLDIIGRLLLKTTLLSKSIKNINLKSE